MAEAGHAVDLEQPERLAALIREHVEPLVAVKETA